MEKNMEQIFREKYPYGSHTVYGHYENNENLTLSSFHYGSDVEDFYGNDEFEYYLTIKKREVPKFVLGCLSKGFSSEEKFSIHALQKMCDEKGIRYTINSYV